MAKGQENMNNSRFSEIFSIRELISGNFFFTQEQLKKNLIYILFVVLLTVVYLYNQYKTEKVLHDIIQTQNEVQKLKAYSVINVIELMSLSKESEVVKLVREKNLAIKELTAPPEKIIVKAGE
ncbi:MAG: hypothetical protein B6I20_03915 [Bacteroidetes bacterium 4572_117]|nr:MAG: hypothetical protein B6I20_03915 [Bacteroidetes bacterium 4572_117]